MRSGRCQNIATTKARGKLGPKEAKSAPDMFQYPEKGMYANEREAGAAAARLMSEKESAPAQLRTYKCLYCGAWHLTSKEA